MHVKKPKMLESVRKTEVNDNIKCEESVLPTEPELNDDIQRPIRLIKLQPIN